MNIDIITREDFECFKSEILEEIRKFRSNSAETYSDKKTWLKSIEVRKLLGISIGTLQNLRINGSLPYTKIGGLLYYKYDDILKLMNDKIEV